MKNKYLKLFLMLFIIFIFPSKSFATELYDVDITVELQENGDAIINSKWNYYDDDNTEHYIVIENLADSTIVDYTVYYNGQPMEFVDNWDIDWSFEEKAGKYGFVKTPNGYELTFGKTNYSNNEFVVQYRITNFVKQLNDYQMVYWEFINDDLAEPPENANLKVYANNLEINENNSKIWTFGFEGEKYFQDGVINAKSTKGFSKSNYLTLLVQFENGIFNTDSVIDEDFEYYRNLAFKGSDYVDIGTSIFLAVLFAGIILLVIYLLNKRAKYVRSADYEGTKVDKLVLNKKNLKGEYFREVPYNGNIGDLFLIFNTSWENSLENYISAYFLKWIKEENIEALKDTKGMFIKKDTISFKILNENLKSEDKVEKYIYSIILEASKGDGVLNENDFKEWAKENYETLESKLGDFKDISRNILKDRGYLETEVQLNRYSKYLYTVYSEKGKELSENLVKFQQYLKDYSLLNSRDSYNVHIWDDFLIYASLFGIAEEVRREFENIYPNYYKETTYDLAAIYYINMYSRGFSSTYYDRISSSSAGGSGFSSIGGGGGSFGGGSGGGSR
ncbi:DUF2207 family protein [Anaerosphaera multitolerans]|nr:DUF2207 domain-containing protein [Anaerosphaera multitolerans]